MKGFCLAGREQKEILLQEVTPVLCWRVEQQPQKSQFRDVVMWKYTADFPQEEYITGFNLSSRNIWKKVSLYV